MIQQKTALIYLIQQTIIILFPSTRNNSSLWKDKPGMNNPSHIDFWEFAVGRYHQKILQIYAESTDYSVYVICSTSLWNFTRMDRSFEDKSMNVCVEIGDTFKALCNCYLTTKPNWGAIPEAPPLPRISQRSPPLHSKILTEMYMEVMHA